MSWRKNHLNLQKQSFEIIERINQQVKYGRLLSFTSQIMSKDKLSGDIKPLVGGPIRPHLFKTVCNPYTLTSLHDCYNNCKMLAETLRNQITVTSMFGSISQIRPSEPRVLQQTFQQWRMHNESHDHQCAVCGYTPYLWDNWLHSPEMIDPSGSFIPV